MLKNKIKKFKPFFFEENSFINILVFLFIALSLIEIFSGITFTEQQKTTAWFVKDVIFLNIVHGGFTFFLFFELKPFKLYRNKYNLQSNIPIEHKLTFLFILFLIFQFFHVKIIYNLGVIFALFYSYYHALRQHLGLFLEANHTNHLLDKTSKEKMGKLDHIFFKAFILITFGYACLIYFPHLDFIYIQLAYISCFMGYAFLIIWIFGFQVMKSKLIFLPRLLVYPLLPSSIFAATALGAVHGIEYFFVSKRFLSSEKMPPYRKFYSLGAVLFIFMTILTLIYHHSGLLAVLDVQLPEPYSKAVWVCLGALSFLHYWLDGQIFKMKDPLVRRYIAPAMKK